MDGVGIANADFVLYVTAHNNIGGCAPGSTVIAFAAACEMEQVLDRYILNAQFIQHTIYNSPGN